MSPPVIKVRVLTTPPSLKIKVLPTPVVKVRVLPRFPASVYVTSPILLSRDGANYTFSFDLNALGLGGVYQPLDSDLTAIAALTTTAYGRSLLTLANAAALAAEVDSFFLTPAEGNAAYQPLDSDLTAIAAVSTAAYGRSLLALANATALAAEVDSFFLTPAEGNAAYQPLDSDLTAIAALTTTSYGRAFLALADASAARTALGLVPGTDVQAYDADLAALAALSSAGIVARTGAGTVAARTVTGTANQITVANGDGVSGNPTLSIPSNAALPGAPTTTTAAVDTNTTAIATTAYVVGQAASATPLGNAATAVVGTATRFARADHVHPGREVLTAARTYYVRTDGSDSNTGLVNSSGGAFLTLQKAIDIVAALDISIYNVTISVGAGTYTAGVIVTGAWIGSGTVSLTGDTTTPSNVIISVTSTNCISVTAGGRLSVGGFDLRTTTSGNALNAGSSGLLTITGAMIFGATASNHFGAAQYGAIVLSGVNYTINGAAGKHFNASPLGYINVFNSTVTVTGTPAFSTAFAFADRLGFVTNTSVTYSGSATGTRYTANSNAVINSNGGGASFFPGSVAGATATGGQYL